MSYGSLLIILMWDIDCGTICCGRFTESDIGNLVSILDLSWLFPRTLDKHLSHLFIFIQDSVEMGATERCRCIRNWLMPLRTAQCTAGLFWDFLVPYFHLFSACNMLTWCSENSPFHRLQKWTSTRNAIADRYRNMDVNVNHKDKQQIEIGWT